MRAQQSKFLASVNSSAAEGLDESSTVQEVSDASHESEESDKVICSLCHDHNSDVPVSYLVFLQVGACVHMFHAVTTCVIKY